MKKIFLLLLVFLTLNVASAQITDSVNKTEKRKIEKDKTIIGKDRKLADTTAHIRKSNVVTPETIKDTPETIKEKKTKKKSALQKPNTNNSNGKVTPSGTTQPAPKSTTVSPKGSNPNGTKVPSGTATVPK